VNARDIDALLNKAAHALPEDEKSIPRQGIVASIQPSLRPVRPLSSTPKLVGALFLVCILVAVAGAARAGFYGFARMTLLTSVVTFSALSLLILLAATEFVHDMVPGSLRRWAPVAVLEICIAVLLGVFALLFRDRGMDHFFSAGVRCLLAGLFLAVPSALLSWLVLRRGLAVDLLSAGLSAGTLGGLAGVGLLELHCANFQSAHVLFWHIAVVPVSAAAGGLLGYFIKFRN
jgi:hypothetical protein